MWDRYDGTDTGDAQVGRLSHAEARRVVLADSSGGGISLRGNSNRGRGGQGWTGIIAL